MAAAGCSSPPIFSTCTRGCSGENAMKVTNVSPGNERLRLKEPSGWFAAGNGFRTALALLSDGAFHLFAYLCLEANRQTGRIEATHKELAAAVNKSKRSIGNHI